MKFSTFLSHGLTFFLLNTKITVKGNRSRDQVTDCDPMGWIPTAQLDEMIGDKVEMK